MTHSSISHFPGRNHLQLNLAKTELLVFPATPSLQHDFTIQLGSSTITPSASVRNLGVIFDDQLTFKEHVARLLDLAGLPYTTSERSGPFWQSMLHNFLSRPLSFPGWTTAMLFWLDFHETSTNDSERSSTTGLQWAQNSSCYTSLFAVADRIQFKTLMLAYRTTTGSAPTYFHSLLWIYIPSRSLRSASERRLVVPSQRSSKSLSRTFSFTVPGWWNDLRSHPYPECWIPVNLQATTENSSLSTLLDFHP